MPSKWCSRLNVALGLFVITCAAAAQETVSVPEQFSKARINELEQRISANPDDLGSRSELLQYYGIYARASMSREEVINGLRPHLLWMIQHHPESFALSMVSPAVNPQMSPALFAEGSKAWDEALALHTNDPAVLKNAAQFFALGDRPRAESLLERAMQLGPDKTMNAMFLSKMYEADAAQARTSEAKTEYAIKALQVQEKALADAKPEERFYGLSEAAKVAFAAGQIDKAEAYATELLQLAPSYAGNFNYGNAVHDGNVVLGRIRLHDGNIPEAENHLLAAGRTPGSPQLDSFGPNMSLAKELLEKGEKDVVLQYFDLCRKFWKMGTERLDQWTVVVRRGQMPDFGPSLMY